MNFICSFVNKQLDTLTRKMYYKPVKFYIWIRSCFYEKSYDYTQFY